HISIAAERPKQAARLIAELWGGRAYPFPPVAEGSWIAMAGDERGSTWVQVGGSSLQCAGGDSGGPWFVSQTALGIHTGSVTNTAGTCFSAWYMSTDRLSGLGTGYSLLYGS
ncbi:MAG TPA: hypothetical protein VK403_05935, partial [Allosphingosinicella sp.]|nr:hypothetical protein [Allosphingosinicella sp.]